MTEKSSAHSARALFFGQICQKRQKSVRKGTFPHSLHKTKKKYPGVSAEHIRCTPEDIVHLPDMNEDEIKQLLRQSVPALQ